MTVVNASKARDAGRYGESMQLASPAMAEVRRRLVLRRAIVTVFWAVTTGLAAAVITRVLSRAADYPAAQMVWIPVFAAGLAAVGVYLWLHQVRPIDWSHVAALGDERYGLAGLLRTAIDVNPFGSAVAFALHRRAVAKAGAMVPAEVAPILPSPSTGWWVTVPVACVLLLVLMPLGAAGPSGAQLTPSPASSTATVSIDNVLRLADAVAFDAAIRGDAYLEAVAETLRDLVPPPAAGSPSQGEAPVSREALESVFEHLARAYGSDSTAEELVARFLGEGSPAAEAIALSDAAITPETIDADQANTPAPMDRLDRLLEASQMDPESSDLLGAVGVTPNRVVVRGYQLVGAEPDMPVSDPVSSSLPPAGEADIIGAAGESGAGDSLLAGAGTQELFGSDVVNPDIAPSLDPLTVVGRERDDGRRIEVDLPPVPGWQDDRTAFDVGEWQPGVESPVLAVAVDPWYRAVAGRYFEPSQETVDRRTNP